MDAKKQNPCQGFLTSSRSKSGYKYVIHDSRSTARAKPWSVNYKGYRSVGFATPSEAAIHVAGKIQIAPKSNKQTTATRLKAVATGGTITKAAAPPAATRGVQIKSGGGAAGGATGGDRLLACLTPTA